MTPNERIDYLVDVLAGGNAQTFAEKTGIFKSKVSDLRHKTEGIRHATYYNRILSAYPQVNRAWLYYGEGKPLTEYTMADYAEENKSLWELVQTLRKTIEQQGRVIDRLTAKVPKKVPKEK